MSEHLIVKIKGILLNEESWYSKHKGESFHVEDFDGLRYIVINPNRGARKRTSMLIKKIDCFKTTIVFNSMKKLQLKKSKESIIRVKTVKIKPKKEDFRELLVRVSKVFTPNIDSRLEQDQEDLLEEIKKVLQ